MAASFFLVKITALLRGHKASFEGGRQCCGPGSMSKQGLNPDPYRNSQNPRKIHNTDKNPNFRACIRIRIKGTDWMLILNLNFFVLT